MRRKVVWLAALVVVLIMVGVAWYSVQATTGVPRAVNAHGQVSPAFSPPPGGISRDQAVAIARQQMGASRVTLESAIVGRFASFAGGASVPESSPDELVWAVTFGGVFLHPCPAPPSRCVPSRHDTVLLDFFAGTVLLFIGKE